MPFSALCIFISFLSFMSFISILKFIIHIMDSFSAMSDPFFVFYNKKLNYTTVLVSLKFFILHKPFQISFLFFFFFFASDQNRPYNHGLYQKSLLKYSSSEYLIIFSIFCTMVCLQVPCWLVFFKKTTNNLFFLLFEEIIY